MQRVSGPVPTCAAIASSFAINAARSSRPEASWARTLRGHTLVHSWTHHAHTEYNYYTGGLSVSHHTCGMAHGHGHGPMLTYTMMASVSGGIGGMSDVDDAHRKIAELLDPRVQRDRSKCFNNQASTPKQSTRLLQPPHLESPL